MEKQGYRTISCKQPSQTCYAVANHEKDELNVEPGLPVRAPVRFFSFPQLNGLSDEVAAIETIDQSQNSRGGGSSSKLRGRQEPDQDKHRNKARAHKKDLEGAVPDNPAGNESASVRAGRHV